MKKIIDKMSSQEKDNKRLYTPIVKEFINKITSGQIPEGSNLPKEIEMAEQFSVSRTAAREVMQKLQNLGLIESKRKGGARVLARKNWSMLNPLVLNATLINSPNVEFFRSLFEARILIEPEAAKYAALRANKTELELIEKALCNMRDYQNNFSNSEKFWKADYAFHANIIEASNNWVFQQLLTTIHVALTASIYLTLEHAKTIEPAIELHQNVFDYIKLKDAEGAQTAMKWLLTHTIREFNSIVAKGGIATTPKHLLV